MINQRLLVILSIASVILLGLSVSTLFELPTIVSEYRMKYTSINDSTAQSRIALIDKAINEVPAIDYFEYTGGFDNPFKIHTVPRPAGRHSSKVSEPRVKLILKGILITDKPLAILEDTMGKTYIRGVGEKAVEQSVIKITESSVTLKDHAGTYELTIEEY